LELPRCLNANNQRFGGSLSAPIGTLLFSGFSTPNQAGNPRCSGSRFAAASQTAWDVANAALFLASDEANFISGVSLPVDGGALVQVG
jgi:NAD(P)-dependent dehydrogenase (short-subunit alcohol dehydrogenase family)